MGFEGSYVVLEGSGNDEGEGISKNGFLRVIIEISVKRLCTLCICSVNVNSVKRFCTLCICSVSVNSIKRLCMLCICSVSIKETRELRCSE